MTDSNAANLYLALPLTNYKSSVTGGAYVDVAPLIKGSGSAKVATQTGNTSISSAVASPFTQYTGSMLWGTTTATTDLFYYSLQLGSNQALTIEFWLYHLIHNTIPQKLMNFQHLHVLNLLILLTLEEEYSPCILDQKR